MNLPRHIAAGFGRKLGYALAALVLAILAAVFSGNARAATPQQALASCQATISTCTGSCTCSDYGLGTSLSNDSGFYCQKNGTSTTQGWVGRNRTVGGTGQGCVSYGYTITACVAPQVYNTVTHQCELPCDQRADTAFSYDDLMVGDITCHAGCEFVVYGVSGGFANQAPSGTSCPGEPECLTGYTLYDGTWVNACRPTDTDGDGIPDVDDDFPTDPGEGTDSDGDGEGDNSDPAPDDPTNGKDEDEEGGDEGDNVSTGGGNCITRPVSTGDGILSQIALQTWETRCAIERSQNADGSLKVANADGSAVGGSSSGGGTDLSMGDATPEELGDPTNGGEHPGVGDLFEGSDLNATVAAGPSEAGFGMSRVCPMLALPNLELSFGTATMPWALMCTGLEYLASLIVLAGTIQWALIIGRAGT